VHGSAAVLNSIWNVVRERGLKVGDQLPSIRDLAHRLDVKQTAVRDALLKAETMGLVKVLPRAGAFLRASAPTPTVTSTVLGESLSGAFHSAITHDDQNLFHLLDARRLIEVELAGRAAEQRSLEDLLPVRRALNAMVHLPPDTSRSDFLNYDVRFHHEIARLSGNHVLIAMQRTLMELLRSHLNQALWNAQLRAKSHEAHAAIYEALVAGDAEQARSAMRYHLSQAYDLLLRDVQQVPTLKAVSHPIARETDIRNHEPG
jgi:GntR family transcriptional repressor for pyruvate dehydrogenase complex